MLSGVKTPLVEEGSINNELFYAVTYPCEIRLKWPDNWVSQSWCRIGFDLIALAFVLEKGEYCGYQHVDVRKMNRN